MLLIIILFVSSFALFAQTGVSLEAEIQKIERTANTQGISAIERHDALVKLARLRQLSGDIEGAARNWLEAAGAVPNQVDDDALLSCAYCLAAMGEWDRARTAIEPLLVKNIRARFLEICIGAIRTGNTSMLASVAANSEYALVRSEIYFMLWKTSKGEAAESWRRLLAAEFPQTPEGRLASGENSAVVIRQSPFWLFIGGLDSLPLMPSSVTAAPAPQTPAPAAQPAVQSAPQPAAQTAPQSAAQITPQSAVQNTKLQTGIFSHRENADNQAANLRQAGFSPSIEQRGEMWAVTVPAGADYSRTVKELKDKGFDAFLLRN